VKFKEIEVKYKADDIKLSDFEALMATFTPAALRKVTVSSWDTYYSNKDSEFIRYRSDDTKGELTVKRKTTTANNNNRVEVNVKTGVNTIETITEFSNLLGYQFNFKIYKTCFIYWFEKVNLVYYTISDENMKPQGSFLEIEANEDYNWESEEKAWETVKEYEEKLNTLGITAQNRLKRSLWEMFKKEIKNG
jgi:predicted adenylyl cyclase CyaB